MKIKVNDEEQIIKDDISISDLLQMNNVEMPDMVTVQLNGAFVKKEDYSRVKLKESDSIDFLYFMGGG